MNKINRSLAFLALSLCAANTFAQQIKKSTPVPAANLPPVKQAPAVQGTGPATNLPGQMQGAQQGQAARQGREAQQLGQQMREMQGLNGSGMQGQRQGSGNGLGNFGVGQQQGGQRGGRVGGFDAGMREGGSQTGSGQSDYVVPGSVRTGSDSGSGQTGGVQIRESRPQRDGYDYTYTQGGYQGPGGTSGDNRSGNSGSVTRGISTVGSGQRDNKNTGQGANTNTNTSNSNAGRNTNTGNSNTNNTNGGKNDNAGKEKEKETVAKEKPDKPDKPDKMSTMPTDEARGSSGSPTLTRSSGVGPGGRGTGESGGGTGPRIRVQGTAGNPNPDVQRGSGAPRDLTQERMGNTPGARPGF